MESNWKLIAVGLTVSLAACQQPGADLEANVYRAGQVNQRQEARVVEILAVLPAKIEVSNEQAKATAQLIGALAGGAGGALIGGNVGHYRGTNALLGGAAGAGAGAVAGSLVPDKTLVEGVSLTYIENGKTLNSAQVGRMCEFKRGKAIVISTGPNETRIQANSDACPPLAGSKT